MVTEEDFKRWLREARPGDWHTYHIGPHLYGLNGRKKETAALALKAAEAGDIFICQERSANGNFAYKAMRLDERLKRRLRSWTKQS